MNDIHLVSNKFNSILYADDTTLDSPLCSFDIFSNGKNYDKDIISKNINLEIKKITDWLALNKLSLNVKKTKYMIFHYRQRNISSFIPQIRIGDIVIERVHDFNFLGLTIDENMSWKSHTHKIANKISRAIGIINSLKNTLPRNILLTLYNSLVLPHIQYSILCWGSNPGKVITRQKQAVRLVSRSKYNSHTAPLFKTMELLNFNDILNLNMLKFYYKLKNNTLPYYLQNICKSQHNYNTRNSELSNCPPLKVRSSKCIRIYHQLSKALRISY